MAPGGRSLSDGSRAVPRVHPLLARLLAGLLPGSLWRRPAHRHAHDGALLRLPHIAEPAPLALARWPLSSHTDCSPPPPLLLRAALQDRQQASIALFSKDAIGLSFTLTWWAYYYLPAGLGPRVAALPPVRSSAKVARAILRANQIVQRVNAAVKLFPGLVGAPLVLGTLAGSGGKLLTDAFSRCAGYPSAGAVSGWGAAGGVD